jgi:3-oxoacyl-[acyl-carrier protein] reductase
MLDEGTKELSGRVALVTGAGRNIGRAIALALAAAGAAVVVNARRNRAEAEAVAAEVDAKGGRGLAVLADVADAEAVERMVAAAVERFGAVHILVNNAALRRETRLDELSFEEWRAVTGSVLDGAFHCVKACLPHLRRAGSGAIVNIGGLSAHTGARDRVHVITAKAGLVGLTRALAHDLAEAGITANCVAPGMIDTARAGAEPQHHSVHLPLVGRRGLPEEVAAAVRYLCGPAGRYVTGQTLHVNGGIFLG